jgi:uncharacterized SAM-binding protein YcdF (DUF218 family)
MFIVKKLCSALLTPMPICLALLAIGLALLWFTRRQRAGKILVSVGAALLAVLSYGTVSGWLIHPLENGYQPLLGPGAEPSDPREARARQARWIVVLGGAHRLAPGMPATSQLAPGTLARLVEGVRLKRKIPGSRLILSGGYGGEGSVHADVVARAAEVLGLTRDDLVLERHTFDTVDEARFIHDRIGADPLILVTSASHLTRALGLFRKQGMDPLPSPADFFGLDDPDISVGSFFPGAGPIAAVERASHEYLGMLFSLLRGQI